MRASRFGTAARYGYRLPVVGRRSVRLFPSTLTTGARKEWSSFPSLSSSSSLWERALSSSSSSNESENEVRSEDELRQRADVRTMGALLGKVVAQHSGEHVLEIVETLRATAKRWRQSHADQDFTDMVRLVSSLSSSDLCTVARAFTHFCAIANAAEYHQRARINQKKRRQSTLALDEYRPDSCGGMLTQFLDDGRATADELYQTLTTQKVELVLTAHPTEVNRRTLLAKHLRVQEYLLESDRIAEESNHKDGYGYEQRLLQEKLEREISLLWQSDDLMRTKPTPQEEAERGTLVIETVLWNALPEFLRRLDATMQSLLGGRGLPLTAAPVVFASWMGGDRDGNPNVTPSVTREVLTRNRIRAATLYRNDLLDIQERLSTVRCDDIIRRKVGDDAREPYRAYLQILLDQLDRTIAYHQARLERLRGDVTTNTNTRMPPHSLVEPTSSMSFLFSSSLPQKDDIYTDKQQLMG